MIDGKVDHRGQTFEYEERKNNKKCFIYRVCLEESIASSDKSGKESNDEKKRKYKEDDFPNFPFRRNETFVGIGFGFLNIFTI